MNIEKTELSMLNDFLIKTANSNVGIRKKIIMIDKFIKKIKNVTI